MSERLETTRGAFRVDVSGPADAPPLVFVAGLGDDHASWSGVRPRFDDAYRTIAFDNRGIGASPITAGPYTTRQMAEDAHAIVHALGLGPVIAVGSSMGGAICQEWALAHPEDLRALVLTNSWGERDAYLVELFTHWIELAERGAGRDLLRSLLLFCYSPGFLAANPEVAPGFVSMDPPDLVGFAASAYACREHDALGRLGGVRVPTLVVAGAQDVLTRPELSAHLVQAIPGARAATIDAAHMIFWERPDEFVAEVRRFLDGLR